MTLEKYRIECGHEAPLSAELLASVTAAPAAASDSTASNGRENDPLSRVAGRAQGFTGSDLVQLCSEAVRQPMREAMDAVDGAASFSGQATVRPLEFRCSSRALALERFSRIAKPRRMLLLLNGVSLTSSILCWQRLRARA